MYIRIAMALTFLQFASSKTMLWNETKFSPSMQISTQSMRLKQNYTGEKMNLSKNLANFDSNLFHNASRNFTEIEKIPSDNFGSKYFHNSTKNFPEIKKVPNQIAMKNFSDNFDSKSFHNSARNFSEITKVPKQILKKKISDNIGSKSLYNSTRKFTEIKKVSIRPAKKNSSENFSTRSFHNTTREMKKVPNRTAKKNHREKFFTTDGIHTANGTKTDRNILHKKAIRHNDNLKKHPEVPINEKISVSSRGKSLSSENDPSKNILIFLIASIFIVTLIIGLTIYTRRSYISIQINQDRDHSKDDKKLRYSEVATEEPIGLTDCNSWKKTMLSKIALFSCKAHSSNNLANPRSEADVLPSTPSTRTLSTKSNNSTGEGSGIESLQELDEKDVATEEKSMKPTPRSQTTNCQNSKCCSTKKGYEENLDNSKMCPKCNHYRDPQMIVKRINDVERKGSRIFIPISLPVTFGSGKIKSFGFPKLGKPTNTNPAHKNGHQEPCSSGIQSSSKSNTNSSKKNGKRCRAACGSSTGKSKSSDCTLSSAAGSHKKEDDQYRSSSSSSMCKSKANSDCSSTAASSGQSKSRQCHVTSRSSTGKSKSSDCTSSNSVCGQSGSSTGKCKASDDTLSSTGSGSGSGSGYCQQQDDNPYQTDYSPSTGKSKTSDCSLSKTTTTNRESICQSRKSSKQKSCSTTKSYASSATCTSKSEVRRSSTIEMSSNDERNYPNSSTSTRALNSECYTSQSSFQQQNEAQQTSNASTGRTARASYHELDETSKDSSICDVSEMKICENYSDEEECQAASYENNNAYFTVGCSTKASILSNTQSISKCTMSSHKSASGQSISIEDNELELKSNRDSPINCEESTANHSKECNGNSTLPETPSQKSNQRNCKNTLAAQLTIESPICSNTPYKAPVKFKVLSTDPNYDPSTLQVKQQLKMLLQEDSSKEQSHPSKNKLHPGQVIYADLCFVQKDAIKCADSNLSRKSAVCKDVEIALPSCSKTTQKQGNIASESESDPGYGPSPIESGESEDTNGHCDKKLDVPVDEIDECYKQCMAKICHDEYPRSSFTRKFSSRFSRRASVDATMKSSISSDSRGSLIQSLNQRLKGNYLYQTKGSSNRSRFNSSSRCTPVFEYGVDDDCDVYEPIQEHRELGNQSARSSMNKFLPRIRSYMTRRKKCSVSGAEQVYTEPSVDEGMTELCENCLKYVPKDISRTIRSRQSTYSDVDKFKHGGTIHLNDLIEVYPNLYPKLPSPIREVLSKGFDDYSVAQYGNLCDNYEPVRESKWSELSSSFENINCIN